MVYITDERRQEISNEVRPFLGGNLLTISQDKGIIVYEANLGELGITPIPSGLIIKSDNQYKIFLNKGCHIHRKRFTWAHELGHFILHKDYLDRTKIITDGDDTLYNIPGYKDVPDDRKLLEIEANYFAVELLMPGDAVRSAFKKDPNVSALAEYFNVSYEAMNFRLQNLSILNKNND